MPRKKTSIKSATHAVMKSVSFESMVAAWLMKDGWQVFIPLLDHGHKTDILISDGPNFYRIQIKTIKAVCDSDMVQNCWQNSHVDLIVYFATNSNWGVIAPAFTEKKRPLNHKQHIKFQQRERDFLRSFHQI